MVLFFRELEGVADALRPTHPFQVAWHKCVRYKPEAYANKVAEDDLNPDRL